MSSNHTLFQSFLALIMILFVYEMTASSIDDGYYRMPVNHEVRISGNFCELRTNHFHAGIDIRSSKGASGDSIFSVAPGYLSRIRVQRSSYGQVLYIDHDNGTTSVYAHLDSFHPKIEQFLTRYQYEAEATEIDLYLDRTKIAIKRGDFIGKMGNTGRSTGPHLHFEIRDTETEEAMNPYLYGFARKDDIKPTILSAWLHELDSLGRFKERKRIAIKQTEDGNYRATATVTSKSRYNGLAIGAFDKANGWHNYTGFYKASVNSNADTVCSITNNRFNFNENKSINSLIDYGLYKSAGTKVVKLYEQQYASQSIYAHCIEKGIITLDEVIVKPLTIAVEDYNGNQCTLTIDLGLDDSVDDSFKKTNTSSKSIINSEFINIGKLDKCLFEDEYINLEKKNNTYIIGSESIPLNGYIPVKITGTNLKEGSILVKSNTTKSFGGKISGESLYTSISELGSYEIKTDDQGPVIKTIRFNKDLSKYSSWKFSVTDNYTDKVENKNLLIEAYIDESYIRSYFDSKSNTLIIKDLDKISEQSNKLSIIATDIHDNITKRHYSLQ